MITVISSTVIMILDPPSFSCGMLDEASIASGLHHAGKDSGRVLGL